MSAERVEIVPAIPPKEACAWLVRGGREGETVKHNLDFSVVTLGWGDWVVNAPVESFSDRALLTSYLDQYYESNYQPDWTESHKKTSCSGIWRFINEINIGDLVVLPSHASHGVPKPHKWIAIGEVMGHAVRDPSQSQGARLRREVEWLAETVPISNVKIDGLDTRGWTVVSLDLGQVRDALSRHLGDGFDWSGDEAGVLSADGTEVPEGAKTRVEVNRYERDPSARKRCLKHYDYTCQVCGLKFEERYGEFAREYMHVHHKTPLSQIDDHENHRITPETDLVAVCPNCHAMLHHHPDKPCDVETLRQLMTEAFDISDKNDRN